MIELDKYEKNWILLIKGHFNDKYPTNAKNWTSTLKPMFEEVYGWSPKEHYNDFLNCMFGKLLDIYLKIQLDESGSNHQLKSIFGAAFYKSFVREQRRPIERAISELCGQIQCNQVIVDGVHRYELK
jgi:hypothetical protein